MKQSETETQLPLISNCQSLIDNTKSSQHCLTTPNKTSRNVKHKLYIKTRQGNSNLNANSETKDKLSELLNRYNIPSPENIIDQLDRILINKLQIEYDTLQRQYVQSLKQFYDKENKALNAEKDQKEKEEKANLLIKEKKGLIQKNYKLRETVSNLSAALSTAQGEVNRINGLIDKDKAYSKEMNALFDVKLVNEQKKLKPYINKLKYLNMEKEHLLFCLEQIDEGNIKKNKEMRKRMLMASYKAKKPKHLSNQLTAKELSDMAFELTIELEDSKEKLRRYINEKHSMNEKLKVQEKHLNNQRENISNLNLILSEKERREHWSKFALNEKKWYLDTLNNQTAKTIHQSLNIFKTHSNDTNAHHTPLIVKSIKLTE